MEQSVLLSMSNCNLIVNVFNTNIHYNQYLSFNFNLLNLRLRILLNFYLITCIYSRDCGAPRMRAQTDWMTGEVFQR